jgi:uncharacterized YigZ family protein
MSKSYPVPAGSIRRELAVSNSRFIGSLAPAFSVEEARAFIQGVKQEFPDASHHVPAYLIGHVDAVIAHCSDAGEPSGTAGRPALAVLSGSGLGDVVVVVTRYFGGTKLGTGGLVRAYGDTVRELVNAVRRATRVLTHTVMMEMPYALLERMRRLVLSQGGKILDEDFTANVVLTAHIAVDHLAAFQHEVSELSAGSIQVEILETAEILVPIEPGN